MKRLVVVFFTLLTIAYNAQNVVQASSSLLSATSKEFTATENEPSQTFDPHLAPIAPVITTDPVRLEVCAGFPTTLSAVASDEIFWYHTPPPLGKPLGKGSTFVTPPLEQGYYVYYAITHNQYSYSSFTSLDIVMVYPLPNINIESSHELVCAGESATISAKGSRNFSWNDGLAVAEREVKLLQNTTYTVTGINTAGCKNTAIYTQRVENCTALREQTHSTSEINIYPNPGKGEFHVSLSVINDNSYVQVFNSTGQLIHNSNIESTVSTIHLESEASGIYIVRVMDGNQVVKQEKIIKE